MLTSVYSSPFSLVPYLPMKTSEVTFHHSSFVYCCKFHPKYALDFFFVIIHAFIFLYFYPSGIVLVAFLHKNERIKLKETSTC
jgi:hypothetical protein